MVWWQAFNQCGEDITLAGVRAWLQPDEHAQDEPADGTHEWPAEDDYGRHALRSDAGGRPREATVSEINEP